MGSRASFASMVAIGHLAEAEAESINKYPDLALKIRKIRLILVETEGKLEGGELMNLLSVAEKLALTSP